jgi:cytochrome P450
VLGNRPPSHADLPRLPYALAVFKEAMRLYPPAYLITRNTLPESRETARHVTVGGHALGPNALVFVNVYGIHRRADLYPDPTRFSPERFLDGAEKSLPRTAYLPFGAGPRICVGNHFALMEGQLVLARLAQRLRLEGGVQTLAEPLPLITLRPKRRMDFRVQFRS